jgi:hypothetical protein
VERFAMAAFALFVVSAEGAAAAAPQQAVVFDRSGVAADTFLVSLSSNGFQLDLGPGGFQCPTGSHVSPGGVVTQGPAQEGVAPSSTGLGTEITNFFVSQPELPLLGFLGAQDDCDLVVSFASVPAYLDQSVASAQTHISNVDVCVGQVEQTYCDVVAAVEAAISTSGFCESCPMTMFHQDDIEDDGDYDYGIPCSLILEQLVTQIPSHLDSIRAALASCEALRTEMLSLLASIGPSETEGEKQYILNVADEGLAAAQGLPVAAQDMLSEIESLRNTATLAAAQSSCAECPNLTGVFLPSAAISLVSNAGVLTSIAEAFQSASVTEPDSDLAARYADIAARMQAIPPERVLHLSHPTGRDVGSHRVALLDQSLGDDGVSPFAVVISAVASEEVMNFVDNHIVLDAWRAVTRTLDPRAPLPDDEDDDNDGVRDVHETGTGQFRSRLDTGTNSLLPDGDSDFFWDGTETNTGSDPNDPGVVPMTFIPIPILGASALALLLVASVLLALRYQRM